MLDYGLIDKDHTHLVTSFVIDENARFGCGSDHALLTCDIKFGARPKVAWKFQVCITVLQIGNCVDSLPFLGCFTLQYHCKDRLPGIPNTS